MTDSGIQKIVNNAIIVNTYLNSYSTVEKSCENEDVADNLMEVHKINRIKHVGGGHNNEWVRLPVPKNVGDNLYIVPDDDNTSLRCELGISGHNIMINGTEVQQTNGTAHLKELALSQNQMYFAQVTSITNWSVIAVDTPSAI